MGCECKSNIKTKDPIVRNKKEFDWSVNGNTVAKWGLFLTITILSPLMLPFIAVALYFAIIKNQKLDVMMTLRVLLRTAIDMRNKKEDELEALDLDSAEVLETIVETVVEEHG